MYEIKVHNMDSNGCKWIQISSVQMMLAVFSIGSLYVFDHMRMVHDRNVIICN